MSLISRPVISRSVACASIIQDGWSAYPQHSRRASHPSSLFHNVAVAVSSDPALSICSSVGVFGPSNWPRYVVPFVVMVFLDDDWVEIPDENVQGRTYFWHRWENRTMWQLPDCTQALWSGHRDSCGRLYYWSRSTQESVWNLPAARVQDPVGDEAGRAGVAAGDAGSSRCSRGAPPQSGPNTAGAASAAQECEGRELRQARDGRLYAREQFLEFYGGLRQWDAATRQDQFVQGRTAGDVDAASPGRQVFVLGMPKCGTTSFQEAFLSCGFRSVHWALESGKNPQRDTKLRTQGLEAEQRLVSLLLQRALDEGLPPLGHLPGVDAISQMDGLVWRGSEVVGSFPQMTLLPALYDAYPKALFILNVRDKHKWAESVASWVDGDMNKRITLASLPQLPSGAGSTPEELVEWFDWHVGRVRAFFSKRDQGRLLEFDIEKSDAEELRDFLGCPNLVWGVHNASRKKKPAKR
ncbi:unnamed protein product [Prorocentrum cordatum]|uniref:WW domain-containing protein n=1 Tax=Prorocentrum cordatum TaxID=2364126 RepID=A0ABN9WT81_9DINO|nr:unnamed protein product [Polarella glacialis]